MSGELVIRTFIVIMVFARIIIVVVIFARINVVAMVFTWVIRIGIGKIMTIANG